MLPTPTRPLAYAAPVEPRGGDDDPTVVAPLDDPTVVAPSAVAPDTTPTPASRAPEPPAVGAPPAYPQAPPAYPPPQPGPVPPPQPGPVPPAYPVPQAVPGYAPVFAAPAPARTSRRRPVAGALVFTGAALFAWYVAGVVANLGVDVLKPSVFVELAGVRVFAPATVVCFGLAWWLRAARSVAAGVLVTLVGLGLVGYAVWQGYRDWRFLIGSIELAGAVLVLLGGLGGLRRIR